MFGTKLYKYNKSHQNTKDIIIKDVIEYVKHKHHSHLAEFQNFMCGVDVLKTILKDDFLVDYALYKDKNIIKDTLTRYFCFTYNFKNFIRREDVYIGIISEELITSLNNVNEIYIAKLCDSTFKDNLYTFCCILSDLLYEYDFNICDIIYLARLLLENNNEKWDRIIDIALESPLIKSKLNKGELLLADMGHYNELMYRNFKLNYKGELRNENIQNKRNFKKAE